MSKEIREINYTVKRTQIPLQGGTAASIDEALRSKRPGRAPPRVDGKNKRKHAAAVLPAPPIVDEHVVRDMLRHRGSSFAPLPPVQEGNWAPGHIGIPQRVIVDAYGKVAYTYGAPQQNPNTTLATSERDRRRSRMNRRHRKRRKTAGNV